MEICKQWYNDPLDPKSITVIKEINNHVFEQGLLKLRISSFQDSRNNEMTQLRCAIGVLNNTRGSVKHEVESAKWGHVVSA